MSKESGIVCSCGYCKKRFLYSELVIEPSYNGKWLDYKTPCKCRTISWSSNYDFGFFDKFMRKMERSQR